MYYKIIRNIKSFKEKIITSNAGSEIVITPLIIAMGTMLAGILIVFSIKILVPYIWYEKLSSTCLKYIFIMEEYGYLTRMEKENLLSELLRQGFEKEKLTIYCTEKRQSYGSPIYLKANYKYLLELPIVGEKEIEMDISRESVSKR